MIDIPEIFLDEAVDTIKLSSLYDTMVNAHSTKLVNKHNVEQGPVDEAEIEGRAAMKSLFSSMNWGNLGDSFILYGISRIEEEGSWKDIKISKKQLYDNFQDCLEDIFERDIEINKSRSEVSNWRFIVGWTDRYNIKHRGLVDILRSQGKSITKIIEMFKLGTKWREGISQMRQIEREFADNPDEAAKKIIALIDDQILNPAVNLLAVRAASPSYSGGVIVNQIPAETTGYYMTGTNGAGMMVIPVENKSQAFAVQRSLNGVIDHSDKAFFPRDAMSGDLGREVKHMMAQGTIDISHSRISDEKIMNMIMKEDLFVILPISLDKLFSNSLSEVLGSVLSGIVGESYAMTYEWKINAVMGFLGRNIYVKVKAKIDNSINLIPNSEKEIM